MNMPGSRDFIRSSESSHSAGPSRITIFVLFTGVRKTLDALWSAGRLVRDLDVHIEIIVPEIVPYPLPLDEPPVLRSFWNHRYRTIVEQAGIDTSIHVCLCRDPREAVDRLLTPGSIVVIGTRHRWWPTREYRFGRWLPTKGYHVIFAGPRSGAPEVRGTYA
jgi:hypothetical protein